jgi:hypothetical protein
MSMTAEELAVLVTSLEALGWQREEERIVAPHGTIWLHYKDMPSFGTGHQLRETMCGRLERIRLNREIASEGEQEDWQRSFDDTVGLIQCLDRVFGGPVSSAGR